MGACTNNSTVANGNEMIRMPEEPEARIIELTDKQRNAMNSHFPGAMLGKELDVKTYKALSNFGFTKDNTLFADSTCPDEINHVHTKDDVTSLFQQRWGKLFPLGGLAGLPFAGQTGWGAFSSHVPINGHIVIVFAPHVGLDFEGKVGSFYRAGQHYSSRACGAAIGAYLAGKDKKSGKPVPQTDCYLDHQMDCIKHLVEPHVEQIANAKNEMAELAYQMFEIHRQFLDTILNDAWMSPNSKLAIIGGIQINIDGGANDRFLPLSFEVRSKDGTSIDYFEKAFKRNSGYSDSRAKETNSAAKLKESSSAMRNKEADPEENSPPRAKQSRFNKKQMDESDDEW